MGNTPLEKMIVTEWLDKYDNDYNRITRSQNNY